MAVASRREDLVYLHGHDRSSGGPAGFETVLRARSEVCKETEIEAWRRRAGELNGRIRRRRRSLNLPNRWDPQTAVRSARGGRPSTGWCASEPDGANGWINAMNESPEKWVNTDAGRTIIGASIVGVFMIITAAAVLIGGQANQSQSGPSTGSQTALPTNPTPAPAPPPVPPARPAATRSHRTPTPAAAPAGPAERSDPHLPADLRADHRAEFSGAEFSGAHDRVELGRADHIDHIGTLAEHHARAGRHVTAKG